MTETAPKRRIDLPRRARAKPIVRWVGGKRWAVSFVSDVVYAYLQRTGGRYYEPFLGGGAVALDLGLPGMVLSDLCEPLINAFRQARNNPNDVLWSLQNYRKRGEDRETYYEIRAEHPRGRVQRAARFFYLNTLCWNGVYRENSAGEFNVPYGSGSRAFITRKRLTSFRAAFYDTELRAEDFRSVICQAQDGDFLFVDPPYAGVFSKYLKEDFRMEDHKALAAELHQAADRGVAFIAMNNDLPEIRTLFAWAYPVRTGELRAVNSDPNGRGKTACLLVASDKSLLD